jgi:processive 1,2-diacylglycerol beta-glucosyltransferase
MSYYEAHYPDDVEVRVVDFFEEFMPGLNVLAKFAYQQSVAFFPDLYGTFFEVSNALPTNPVVHELRIMGFQRATNYIDEFRPDAVISTFPVAGGVVSDIKQARHMVVATVITDYGVHRTWLHPATDLYFVASPEVREGLVAQGLAWDRVVVSGIPVHEKFSQAPARAECRADLGLSERFTVLLTAAAGLTSEVRDIAGQLAAEGIQVVASTGHHPRLKRRLETLAKREGLVHVFGFTPQMHRMMRSADVLVGKAGGLTVSESLAVGLPLIIYNPVPGQEIYNVDFLVNSGAGLLSRDEEDVVEKVRFLANHPDRLRQMAANAQALGKPEAAQAVCEQVLADLR